MEAKSWKIFNIVAGSASIFSVAFLLLTDRVNGMIALIAFCIFLLFLLILVTTAIFRLIRQENPEEYKKIAAFTSYEAVDEAHGVFEVFKVIQSKRLILQQVEHNFKWTGTKRPVISSELQEIKQLVMSDNKDYDKALLRLKRPLGFNESCTIHFKALTDDFDGMAQPHLDFKVNSAMNVIHFRVTLKNKGCDYCKAAKILKKPIESNAPLGYEQYGSIPFDMQSKSYQYCLTDPEIGYFYRLEWEK
jgi:Na+-transporting methylmalonyl-CoA/oxaloacetate decarboxylase gamma subunit